MSSENSEGPFKEASDKVEEAHQEAVAQLRAKVARAKSDALKKVSA